RPPVGRPDHGAGTPVRCGTIAPKSAAPVEHARPRAGVGGGGRAVPRTHGGFLLVGGPPAGAPRPGRPARGRGRHAPYTPAPRPPRQPPPPAPQPGPPTAPQPPQPLPAQVTELFEDRPDRPAPQVLVPALNRIGKGDFDFPKFAAGKGGRALPKSQPGSRSGD